MVIKKSDRNLKIPSPPYKLYLSVSCCPRDFLPFFFLVTRTALCAFMPMIYVAFVLPPAATVLINKLPRIHGTRTRKGKLRDS